MSELKQQQVDIQNAFLRNVMANKVPLTVFLINGFQFRGTIKSFDNFTIELESEGKQQMVYKHAVSTIVPAKPVSLH